MFNIKILILPVISTALFFGETVLYKKYRLVVVINHSANFITAVADDNVIKTS